MFSQHLASLRPSAWLGSPARTLLQALVFPSPSRIPSLDGLRGFAALLIFAVHAHLTFSLEPLSSLLTLWFLNGAGHAGVDIFFLLSGYLIYRILISRHQPYRAFLIRRAQRIYPTFTAVFLLYIVLSFAFPERSKIPTDLPLLHLLQNFLLLPGIFDLHPMITVAWSLSYEAFYYLTVPCLVRLLLPLTSPQRCLVLASIALLYTVYSVADRQRALALGPLILPPAAHMRLILFAAGMAVHEVSSWPRTCHWLQRRENLVWVAALATVPLLYLIEARIPFFHLLPGFTRFPEVYRTWIIALLLPPALLSALFPASRAFRFFSSPALVWLGHISYSFYLIHGLVLLGVRMVFRFLAGELPDLLLYWTALSAATAAALAASLALFILVERPFSLAPNSRKQGPL